MASGQTLLTFGALHNEPNTVGYTCATLDMRNGHPVIDFDPSTQEYAFFMDILPRSYAGGGLSVYLHVAFSTATTGTARFSVQFENMTNPQDIDSDGFASAKSVNFAAPATSGVIISGPINFTDGAEIDSINAGQPFRIAVFRDATNVADDAAGDAELVAIEIKET